MQFRQRGNSSGIRSSPIQTSVPNKYQTDMISLDKMLGLIFTKKRLVVGIQRSPESPKVVKFDGQWSINYEGKDIPTVLSRSWDTLVEAYNSIHGDSSHLPMAVSFPAGFKDELKDEVKESLRTLAGDKFFLYHEDLIPHAFILGLHTRGQLEGKKFLALEAMDDYTNLWYVDVVKGGMQVMGKENLSNFDNVRVEGIKEVGPSAGRGSQLSELIREFREAGLNLNLDAQTDLAHQLINPPSDFTFNINQSTASTTLKGKVKLSEEKFKELEVAKKEKLADFLSRERIDKDQIEHIYLIGPFFQNDILISYLEQELNLADKLLYLKPYDPKVEYETIIQGLHNGAVLTLEAEERRQEAEEKERQEVAKKEKLKAELEAKDARELLFADIRKECVDPSRQEEYETMFIPKGEQLGIPDVVIKWNISEILSKISLEKEAENVGIINQNGAQPIQEATHVPETPQVVTEALPEPEVKNEISHATVENIKTEVVQNGHHETPIAEAVEAKKVEENLDKISKAIEEEVKEEVKKEGNSSEQKAEAIMGILEDNVANHSQNGFHSEAEKTEEPKTETIQETKEEELPTSEEKTEEPVLSTIGAAPIAGNNEVKPVIKLKENQGPNKPAKKQLFSLGDIFSLKKDLPDTEFITKIVSFRGDSVNQTLRLLKDSSSLNSHQIEEFKKLHAKEVAHYETVSDISESKEGLYFYRPYIERNSLKNYLTKQGMNKKEHVDDLSSNELKFILMVFKEVRSLAQSHADLNEENILIQEKRTWSLAKNIEISFVGFTAKDATNAEMIEATHEAFSRIMGANFYQEFRKKFQL